MNLIKRIKVLCFLTPMALVSVVHADTPDAGAKGAKLVKPAKITCADFLTFDDETRPKIVYWAEGFNGKGKGEDVVFDTERVDRLVPVMVEVCTKEPKASFWSRAKAEFKKVF